MPESIGEVVRQMENDYIQGSTQLSKYVNHSMYETINIIDAYVNSKHLTGEQDSLGRDKPFFNIVNAAINVTFRATDQDRGHIKIRASESGDWLNSFLATIHLQDWMRREMFGTFLNKWGRTLATYGSAVVKFVEDSDGLHISIINWQDMICDSVDFNANPKIEVLELTPAQLKQRIKTHGYTAAAVKGLLDAITERETLNKQRKDNKTGYIKLYEVHGLFPKSYLTGKKYHEETYVQQMHVISFIGKRDGRSTEYDDYTLFSGEEETDPYMITSLLEVDGRTLSIGPVENLFQAQWMTNHSMKTVKDTLDIGSRLVFQTADSRFVGRNVLANIESGDILIHNFNMPLTQVATAKPDVTSMLNYGLQWKQLGNEINGISEAMLGQQPKSGTAWRLQESVLTESYSLFEIMTENKGLDLEKMLRTRIIPYIKRKHLNNADEIAATLEQHDIQRIDSRWLRTESIRRTNKQISDALFTGQPVTQDQQAAMMQNTQLSLQESLTQQGNKRFFKPSEIDETTWREQFKDLEWELEIDITGENKNVVEALSTLNTALQTVMIPGFEQNQKAQAIVGRILEFTGAMSPVEWSQLASPPAIQSPIQPGAGPQPGAGSTPPTFTAGPTAPQRNL